MSTTRRKFLAAGLSAGAAAPFLRRQPSWLDAVGASAGPTDAVLVVVQIRGGWDMLQMFPEVDHPKYIAARPDIKLVKSQVLTLASGAKHYWHPAMAPFKALYDRGDLAVIQNIGYPKPTLSHFASEKKWLAADPTAVSVDRGWLSAYLEKGYTGTFSIPALNIESRRNGAFIGTRVPVFRRARDFKFNFDASFWNKFDNATQLETLEANAKAARLGASPNLLHIAGSTADAVTDSALLQNVGSSYSARATYPNNALSGYLQLAARYITAGLGTRIYLTSWGGFDTHGNEVIQGATATGALATRLAQVTGSVKAFLDDMSAHNQGKRVVVMLFSEFSRRLGQNGSLGTDHGHGGMAFFAGEPVRPGLYGTAPDLARATTPYNKYYIPFDSLSTDFRRMYAEVITKWFNVGDHSKILGGTFPLLGIL